MTEHKACIRWAHSGEGFKNGRYSREHTWSFDGGLTVPASPSPAIVPAPWSNAKHVDPEEAFVASISSCHMLFFLELSRKASLEVESYEDDAVGRLEKNDTGSLWLSHVVLRPKVRYRSEHPGKERERELHAAAHHGCFIASSVKTQIVVELE